jgi:hypothetical protein
MPYINIGKRIPATSSSTIEEWGSGQPVVFSGCCLLGIVAISRFRLA